MRYHAFLVMAAVLLSGCSGAVHNPTFLSVVDAPSGAPCDEGQLCIEVRAEVGGTRQGLGTCKVFGPSDPDVPGDPEALAVNDELVMRPGVTTVWVVSVPAGNLGVGDLYGICSPMAEG
jgi:hypothetical protein